MTSLATPAADALASAPAIGLDGAGAWRIESELGRGAMGVVYGVVHDVIGKRAALKVLQHASHRAYGLVEARVVNRIAHPSIVDIFETGALADGRLYLVMERLEGATLRELAPSVSARTITEILREVARAMAAAHAANVIHRDLKPDHVMVLGVDHGAWRIKVIDWGVAAIVDPAADRRIDEKFVVGTANYVSPEQACGCGATTASDVYALGVTAYEMYLGRLPFEGTRAQELLQQHVTAIPPRPTTLWPAIPPVLERLLGGMLSKDPAQRPTMAAVAAMLDSVLAALSEGGTARPGERRERHRFAAGSRADDNTATTVDVAAIPTAAVVDSLVIAVEDTAIVAERPTVPMAVAGFVDSVIGKLLGTIRRAPIAAATITSLVALLVAWIVRHNDARAAIPPMPPPPPTPQAAPMFGDAITPRVEAALGSASRVSPVVPRSERRLRDGWRARTIAPKPPRMAAAPEVAVAPTPCTISSSELVARYTAIGRSLRDRHAMSAASTAALWPRYRQIQIQRASATLADRCAAVRILDGLATDLAQPR